MTKLSSKCGVFAFLFGFILVLKYYKNNAFEYLQIHCKNSPKRTDLHLFFWRGGGGGGGVRGAIPVHPNPSSGPACFAEMCSWLRHFDDWTQKDSEHPFPTSPPPTPQSFFRNSLVQPCSNNNNTKKKKKKKKGKKTQEKEQEPKQDKEEEEK